MIFSDLKVRFPDEPRKFYLVVSAGTDADEGHRVCGGGSDLGLNEAGLMSARKFALRFKKNPFKFKRMISCPELRTVQMADILHDEMRVRLTLWPDFSDQFMGEWEGLPIDSGMDFSAPPRGE